MLKVRASEFYLFEYRTVDMSVAILKNNKGIELD